MKTALQSFNLISWFQDTAGARIFLMRNEMWWKKNFWLCPRGVEMGFVLTDADSKWMNWNFKKMLKMLVLFMISLRKQIKVKLHQSSINHHTNTIHNTLFFFFFFNYNMPFRLWHKRILQPPQTIMFVDTEVWYHVKFKHMQQTESSHKTLIRAWYRSGTWAASHASL